MSTSDLVVLTFSRGDRSDVIARRYGKVCLLARRGNATPKDGEKWVCAIDEDAGRFYRVRVLKRADAIPWAWVPTGKTTLGVPEVEWAPAEPGFRPLRRELPRPPETDPAPRRAHEAAVALEREIRHASVPALVARFGRPVGLRVVENTTHKCSMVEYRWDHPVYTGLSSAVTLGMALRVQERPFDCAPEAWAALPTEFRDGLPVQWTGQIRVVQDSPWDAGCKHVEAEVSLGDAGTGWVTVRSLYETRTAPPEITAAAEAALLAALPPLDELADRYEAALANARLPWRWLARRAIWLADEDGRRTRVIRWRYSRREYEDYPESEDGYRPAGTVSVTRSYVEDAAVTGYLRAGGTSRPTYSTWGAGPDLTASMLVPVQDDWEPPVWEKRPHNRLEITLRRAVTAEAADFPDYPTSHDLNAPVLLGHPTAEARAAVLAEELPEPTPAPSCREESAYPAELRERVQGRIDAARAAWVASMYARADALAADVRAIFAADDAWAEAQTELAQALVEARATIREHRISVPEALMAPAPADARLHRMELRTTPGALAPELLREAEAMRRQAEALRAHLADAVAALRLPPPPVVEAPVVAPVSASPVARPEGRGVEQSSTSAGFGTMAAAFSRAMKKS